MNKKEWNFDLWCRIAAGRIGYKPDREAVADELRGHLDDAYDAYIAKGMTPDEAEVKTLETMGRAEDIAPQLAAIHKPFWGYALRTCQILLIALLVLSLIPIWNYIKDLDFQDPPTYRDFAIYDEASYGGDTGRTLHHLSQPDISFSSDGSTFTLTNAVVYTEYSEYLGRDRTYLYVRIRQTSLLPQKEHDHYFRSFAVTGWFCARDSLGNIYEGFMDQSTPDASCLIPSGSQTGIFTYTHECWINDFPADAQWVEICYQRDGRDFALRVDLTGGDGK